MSVMHETDTTGTDWDDAVLNGFVWVHDETGGHHPFGPGDRVPEWARSQIGAHLLTRTPEVPSDTAMDELLRSEAERFELTDETDEPGRVLAEAPVSAPPAGTRIVDRPPNAGPGASRGAWADYARDLGVHVPDHWVRKDIQDAVARAESIR